MKILVVEDEQEITKFLKSGLKAEDFLVDVAEDGERGAALGQLNDYDVIILDINLPKKTGIDVCREIRASGKRTPIIVLSAKSETSTKVMMLEAGADDYVSKPFSLDELIARIKAVLRRPHQSPGELLHAADLVLDTNERTVKRGTAEISLTGKESMLLSYLIRSGGAVVSRSMIMEHVWGMSRDPFSNTIDSHIKTLRRKIDFAGKKKLIHTVRGRGFRITL